MGVIEDLADELARDVLAVSTETHEDTLVEDVSKAVGALSTTMQEAYMTAIRIRRAEMRGRRFLEAEIKARTAAGSSPDG